MSIYRFNFEERKTKTQMVTRPKLLVFNGTLSPNAKVTKYQHYCVSLKSISPIKMIY